eukprot:TRINITY_DN1851_c1_g1_i1.p1 TRINITY_DN1851_c1_g1~~TRINITY_DN1851_c1_g1_i1.p1  ORF type:complete len:247 (+),score=56.89 TRINITY_DN1851_c1_g1_i1:145-885(+)
MHEICSSLQKASNKLEKIIDEKEKQEKREHNRTKLMNKFSKIVNKNITKDLKYTNTTINIHETERLINQNLVLQKRVEKGKSETSAFVRKFDERTRDSEVNFNLVFQKSTKAFTLRGTYDLIEQDENGDYIIVEMKRNGSTVSAVNNLQLKIYALAFYKHRNILPKCELRPFGNAQDNSEIYFHSPTLEELETVEEFLWKIWDLVEEDVKVPTSDYLSCKFCSYAVVCPFAPVTPYGDSSPRKIPK